jgi:hypothetical protein
MHGDIFFEKSEIFRNKRGEEPQKRFAKYFGYSHHKDILRG